MLEREIYTPLGGAGEAPGVNVSYVDSQLTREEFWFCHDGDDAPKKSLLRRSTDNGRTWSFPISTEDEVEVQHKDGGLLHHRVKYVDPATGGRFDVLMRRQWPGMPLHTMNWDHHQHPFLDHCFVCSEGNEIFMKYQKGSDFDPENPFDPGYLCSNCAYFGVPELMPDGRGFLPLVCYPELLPGETRYDQNVGGLILMRRDTVDGPWLASNYIVIDSQLSSRGIMEPETVMLSSGVLLTVCRGSNAWLDPNDVPGRKWMSISTDGGKTISEINEFKYDDGTSFCSPSSIHTFLRSTRNGKLYWLANIIDGPSHGNMPRHPLYICEIDEDKIAVKKDSLVLVDQRQTGEPDSVQLSNFSVLENRETLDFEIYLTRLGEVPGNTWNANVYRYIFKP